MSGLFDWIDRVQTYDRGGFNYIAELNAFVDRNKWMGEQPPEFVNKVVAIAQVGCHDPPCRNAGCLDFPCPGASPKDAGGSVRETFSAFYMTDLYNSFKSTGTGTIAPSPAPTPCVGEDCTSNPTYTPTAPTASPTAAPVLPTPPPTNAPSPVPTSIADTRKADVVATKAHLKNREGLIENNIFVSDTASGLVRTKLYSLDGLLRNMEELANNGVDGMAFFMGQGGFMGQDGAFEYGLVNIALFRESYVASVLSMRSI